MLNTKFIKIHGELINLDRMATIRKQGTRGIYFFTEFNRGTRKGIGTLYRCESDRDKAFDLICTETDAIVPNAIGEKAVWSDCLKEETEGGGNEHEKN